MLELLLSLCSELNIQFSFVINRDLVLKTMSNERHAIGTRLSHCGSKVPIFMNFDTFGENWDRARHGAIYFVAVWC